MGGADCPVALSAADMVDMAGPRPLLDQRLGLPVDEGYTVVGVEYLLVLRIAGKCIGLDRKGRPTAIQVDIHLPEMVDLMLDRAAAEGMAELGNSHTLLAAQHVHEVGNFQAELALGRIQMAASMA